MHGERKQSSSPAVTIRVASFVAASLLSIGAARADVIVNPGFETGNLNGWVADGPVSVVQSFTGILSGPPPFTSDPCCGDSHYFAQLDATNNNGSGTSLTQTVLNVAAGQDLFEVLPLHRG